MMMMVVMTTMIRFLQSSATRHEPPARQRWYSPLAQSWPAVPPHPMDNSVWLLARFLAHDKPHAQT
eukprot:1609642-Karenia_brevis.AAC.1